MHKSINYRAIDKTKVKKWHYVWRALSCVAAIFFILAAIVQLNDPDPYIWIPIYGTAGCFAIIHATCKFAVIKSSYFCGAIASYIVATLIYSLWHLNVVIMSLRSASQMRNMNASEVRNINAPLSIYPHDDIEELTLELSGLLIVLAFSASCLWYSSSVAERCRDHYNIDIQSMLLFLVMFCFSLCPPLLWASCHINIISTNFKICRMGSINQCP